MKEQLKQGFKRTFRMALQRGSYFAKVRHQTPAATPHEPCKPASTPPLAAAIRRRGLGVRIH